MKPNLPVLVFLLTSWFANLGAIACRYNVRDIGFVDLETDSYRLYAYVSQKTPREAITTLTETATVTLAESNIQFEVIDTRSQQQHPAMRYFAPIADQSLLPAVFVSPDGHTLPVSLIQPGLPARQTITAALQQLVSSPKREEIVQQASQAFGVVLFIEGPETDTNQRLREVIARSIKQITSQMQIMPKLISVPPALVVVAAADLAQEQLLLWSLGLQTNPVSTAMAAIIYGRARWMGPLMKGEEITERNLTGLLSVIGADCECGLDLSWTSGTRLPIKWDTRHQTDLAKRLGFDPENPVVKMEVSRILSRGSKLAAPGKLNPELTQGTLSQPPSRAALQVSPPTNHVSSGPHPGLKKTSQAQHAVQVSSIKKTVLVLTGIGIVIFSIGLGIALRAAGRR